MYDVANDKKKGDGNFLLANYFVADNCQFGHNEDAGTAGLLNYAQFVDEAAGIVRR